jgi:hypothetical protein
VQAPHSPSSLLPHDLKRNCKPTILSSEAVTGILMQHMPAGCRSFVQ